MVAYHSQRRSGTNALINKAFLILEDGTVYRGQSVGASHYQVGEVVFNTSMTGYQEILSDPSYARQLVTLTYPHIGNTGCNDLDQESDQVFASGLIVKDVPRRHSNFRAEESLSEFLIRKNVPGISGIDTRALTRRIREKGAQSACLVAGDVLTEQQALEKAQAFGGLKGLDLAKEVCTKSVYEWNEGLWELEGNTHPKKANSGYHVVAFDFGVKKNILRYLVDRGCKVTVVPAQTPFSEIKLLAPDGVFLSNGPGDPEPCDYAIEMIKQVIDAKIPIFGICLGHQLLALASGAETVKMKFGHHGGNHPVQDLASNKVMVTAQNHGFAVNEEAMPEHLEITHRSLFDNTVQGIRRTDCAAFSFQGHPEASPGPHDVEALFDQFIQLMEAS